MENNKLSECSDQTIISGFGVSSEMDLSLSSLNLRTPNAASTSLPRKSRDDYLDFICLEKENNLTSKLMPPPVSCRVPCSRKDKDILKDITPNKNPNNFENFSVSSVSKVKISDLKNTNLVEKLDNSNSNCYSKCTASSNSGVMDDEELDLKKGSSSIVGLPSILIGKSGDDDVKGLIEEQETFCWKDCESHVEENGTDLIVMEEPERKGQSDLLARTTEESQFTESLCRNYSEEEKYPKEREEEEAWGTEVNSNLEEFLRDQTDLSAFLKDEKFHSPTSGEFSAAEEENKRSEDFQIQESALNSNTFSSDLSGVLNISDLSIHQSLWDIGKEFLGSGKKLNIEDIFAAKSSFMSSENFGDILQSSFMKAENFKPSNFSNDESHNTPQQNEENSPGNSTFNVEIHGMGNKSELLIDLDGSVSSNRSFVRESTGAIPKTKLQTTESFSVEEELQIQENVEAGKGNMESYMKMLRQLFEKASEVYDPKVLVREIFASNASVDIEETFETSADVEQMRKIRQRLQMGTCNSKRTLQVTETKPDCGTKVEESYLGAGLNDGTHTIASGKIKMGTGSLINPISSASSFQNQGCRTNEVTTINASCLTGIQTTSEIAVKNPTSKTLRVLVQQIHDSFKQAFSTIASFKFYHLDFDSEYFLTPDSYLTIPIHFHSNIPGSYMTKFSISLYELGVSSDNSHQMEPLLTDFIHLCIDIKEIEIDATCDDILKVNFGLVPEYCLVEKELKLTNKSKSPVPILMRIHQITARGENLYWLPKQPHLKLISNSLAACELPTDGSLTASLALRAPSVEDLNANGIIPVESFVEVLLDSPQEDSQIITRIPVEAHIGEILLRTFRSTLPVTIESEVGKSGSSNFSLRNKSLFPLNLSVQTTGHEALSVASQNVTIPSQEDAQIIVTFNPPSDIGETRIEGKLLIMVQPYGIQMDLSVLAISKLPENVEEIPMLENKEIERNEPVISSQLKIDKKVALSSNATSFFFGTKEEGTESTEKFALYNGWHDDPLSLQISIKGNEDIFSFDFGDKERSVVKDIVIEPKGKVALNIKFAPDKTKFFSSSIVCKTKAVLYPVKVSIPVYGFGGTGSLLLKKEGEIIKSGSKISFGKVKAGTPSLLRLTASNTGTRFIFVKFNVLSDEVSETPLGMGDLFTLPSDLILGPGETKDVVVITTCSSSIMQSAPGRVGVLQGIYGDEILRRKLRKHKNPSFKRRKINDVRLLKINFDDIIEGENSAHVEEDGCPRITEDIISFYNGCKKLMIPLTCEVDGDLEGSTMIDLVLDQDKQISFDCSTNEESKSSKEIEIKPENHFPIDSSTSFGVFPPFLKLTASQKSPIEVSVVNFRNETQIFEVFCENKMLCVEPREITVSPMSFFMIKVQPVKSNIPRNIPKITCSSFKILGKNDEKVVSVELEVDNNFTDNYPQRNIKIIPSSSKKVLDIPSLVRDGVEYVPKPVTDIKKRNNIPKPKIEVLNEVKFSPTQVNAENAAKLALKNFDSEKHEVKVSCSCRHFYVRHTSFTISEMHCLQIPVYFKPKESGLHIEYLSLRTNLGIFQVKLLGKGI